MKIIIVGFGNMGCRHAQSLINSMPTHKYFVLEPNKEIFLRNIQKIEVLENQFTIFDNTSQVPDGIDFAIVATSAGPRHELVKMLINKGIKFFLLEKIVFQSRSQFDEIIDLLDKNGCVAYCNFVNRYFPNYIEIKKKLEKSEAIKMYVNGGDIRLGSNCLHYIDLFEYLTGKSARIIDNSIKENKAGSKKGLEYRELLGQIILSTNKGDLLIISADENRPYVTEIIITQDSQSHIISEQTSSHLSFSKEKGLKINKFISINTSQLTSVIFNDIITSKTLLPSVKETKNCHIELFKIANIEFGLNENEICPLT